MTRSLVLIRGTGCTITMERFGYIPLKGNKSHRVWSMHLTVKHLQLYSRISEIFLKDPDQMGRRVYTEATSTLNQACC